MSQYSDFAYYYDKLMMDVDYDEWYGYIREILDLNSIDYSSVLEMGCGTGNMTERIYRDKDVKSITCFDISEDMLMVAREKLGKYPNIRVLKQDMKDIKLSEKYDLIISACDSINYILEDEDIIRIFEKAYSITNKGGAFLFDINAYDKLKNTIGNNIFIDETEDIYYVWENEYNEEEEISNFYLTFFIREEDGRYSRFDEHHTERAYRDTDIEGYLYRAGFKEVNLYHDFRVKEGKGKPQRSFFLAIK